MTQERCPSCGSPIVPGEVCYTCGDPELITAYGCPMPPTPSGLNLDDVLLRLNWEVNNETGLNAVFARLEADRILEGKVREKRRPQFIRVCQDLRFSAEEIDRLQTQVKWS